MVATSHQPVPAFSRRRPRLIPMPVLLAYLGLILIWSTTPISIQWSTEGLDLTFSVFSRMLIGWGASLALLIATRTAFPWHPRARRAYLVGGLGLFSSMTLTYWAARHIHSGLISVMFGLSPLMASVMATMLLGEKSLTPIKIFGATLGVSGLAVIFLDSSRLGGTGFLLGLCVLFLAVFFYSAGLVWLKRIGDDSPPLATTTGTLFVASLLFGALWGLSGGSMPTAIPVRSGVAVLYLGLFGSTLAFTLYYYLIKHLRATVVSLSTLLPPVLALLLGSWLNGEATTPTLWFGTSLILLGLIAHQYEALRPMLRSIVEIKR